MVNKDYDERSYQDELDAKFYGGRKPSEKAPYTLKELATAIARLIISMLGKDVFVMVCYFLTDSVEQTCKKCRISKRTFFYYKARLIRRFHFFLARQRHHK